MVERAIGISTAEGSIETFVAHPDAAESIPAVLVYMDAPGIREELYAFARRIAAQGYYVLLPDLYHRLGRKRFSSPVRADEREQMFECMRTLTNEMVLRDTRSLLDHVRSEPIVREGSHGCIGYCMSGQFVVSVAGTFPDEIGAAASLYGVRIVTDEPDSPHLLAGQIEAELYLGFASHDPYVPEPVIPELRAALDKHGVSYRLDIWPETEHGFCFPEREVYRERAAEDVWNLVFDLYKRRLS